MSRSAIIAVLGVDGSGKTTQAKMLAEWLTAEGVPARYFENPGGRRLTDRIAHRLGREDTSALVGRIGRVVLETFVRAGALGRAAIWARLTGRVAVMDRYSYCQYAVIRARSDRGERFARAILRPFRAPHAVCYLAVPPTQAQMRVALRGYDHEELAHLIAFADAYHGLPEAPSFLVLDASGEVAEVHALLQAAVRPAVGLAR